MEEVPFTKQGYDLLVEELQNLKTNERPKVIEAIAEARAHGDLKENAEYHAAREKQSFIEGRITMLDDSLARAKVISVNPDAQDVVQFSAWVSVEDIDSGDEKSFRIVGDLEADISKNLISAHSPLGRALLGKRLDDEVLVKVPKGDVNYLVTDIKYEE